ncbi:unnamed protein product [Effrenium voratum]|nr:unnamed protein product [Effrenium voratum]
MALRRRGAGPPRLDARVVRGAEGSLRYGAPPKSTARDRQVRSSQSFHKTEAERFTEACAQSLPERRSLPTFDDAMQASPAIQLRDTPVWDCSLVGKARFALKSISACVGGKEADVSPSRSLRGNADDASPRSRKEEREAKEGKDADESPTRSLTSHIERGAARIKEAELIPSEPPKEPPKPKESKEGEAEVLVKRVCESLDRKFGSVDAAFLSMSVRFSEQGEDESPGESGVAHPVDVPKVSGFVALRQGLGVASIFTFAFARSGDDKEDRTLLQLRGCLVESGVGHKDATLLLQAMRSGLPGQMPSLQDVANSLRPGCLQQAALDQAKKKSAFSLSGSDDPNINLDSIRGISNLDARSILERQGAPVILPLPAPPGARSRSNSPGKRSGSSSPKRNA